LATITFAGDELSARPTRPRVTLQQARVSGALEFLLAELTATVRVVRVEGRVGGFLTKTGV
jgi:hypothetical protein